MKKATALLGILASAVVLSAPVGFAADAKAGSMNTEILIVKNRSCNELPADIQAHSLGCEQITFGKRSYAKVKVGYQPLERQAMVTEELAMQHGG